MKERQKVLIAMPCIRGELKVFTALSILGTVAECHNAGISAQLRAWVGDSILPSARNILFGMFYEDKSLTDLVFWDDDICCPEGSLTKLLSYPVDFVGGTYRIKKEEIEFPLKTLPGERHSTDPVTGLLQVAGVPTGFMRITRAAADKLVEAYKDLEYDPQKEGAPKRVWCLFDWPFRPGKGLYGEDWGFCEKWTAIGGKVWLDPKMRLSHVGIKEYGPASLHEHLSTQGKVQEAA